MSKTYRLSITGAVEGPLVRTDGDLNAIAYHASKAKFGDGEYAVTFIETTAIAGDEERVVSQITADGEVVALVLKKKLKQERAAEATDEPAPPADATVANGGGSYAAS